MRYALITGASSGIGLCFAEQLASAGHNIIVVSNRPEQNHQLVAQLKERYGVEALAYDVDLTEADAAERLYAFVEEIGAQVDILINNAGMLLFSTLSRSSLLQIEKIIALHCLTPTKLCRLFGADMCRRGEGRILIVSSITAWMAYPTISLYASTKSYLKSMGESLQHEFKPYGVTLTMLFPSAVDTSLYKLDDGPRRWLLRLGVMMRADDVARRALRALMRGRRRSLPGFLTKVEVALCALLPGWVITLVMKIPAIRRIVERV